ncbi:hypothetical protein J7E88_21215 [Streptomyces sp. ISL-10]|uniref:hypothetical protein n=1 Tax=Streptomyces sp. ISL-10 TaxID=2819172 RepID=UPI001BEA9021|nr:hypothetical protein [Streptomyces sp. ISL-10]MBT2367758.1 hypothetical protein [Streptomyces sp. ISL-10]
MADERYEWLDRDAAEKLLRGEPVEAADEHARTQAARLFEVLDGVTADPGYRYDDGELPGEAAAMAAFRKARADAAAPAGGVLGTVGVTRPAVPVRGLRFGRPMRFGIAAAVAACALGGVAVAAGTGVLPTPFSGDEHPLPASSVSAAETPGPMTSSSPGADGASTPPGAATPPVPPSAGGDPSASASGQDGTATPGGSGAGDGGLATPGAGDVERNAELRRKAVESCRDYRNGTIAPERKKSLEEQANGAERVQRFCDRLLDGEDGGGRGEGGGDKKDDGSGDGDGKGDADRDADVGGTSGADSGDLAPLPPISFTLVPQDPAPTPTASGTASASPAIYLS